MPRPKAQMKTSNLSRKKPSEPLNILHDNLSLAIFLPGKDQLNKEHTAPAAIIFFFQTLNSRLIFVQSKSTHGCISVFFYPSKRILPFKFPHKLRHASNNQASKGALLG
jgi:hypothetical protein